MAVIDLANPTRFLDARQPRAAVAGRGDADCSSPSASIASMNAPDDYQQGATVKIMFLHVPAAWLGMFGWGVMSVAALGTLVWRHPLADVAGKAAAPIGAAFTLHLPRHRLAVGPADLGHLLGVGRAADLGAGAVPALSRRDRAVVDRRRPGRGARAAAILTLVGAVNLPIIKFSVDWWNTLHQPASVFPHRRLDHRSRRMLMPLLIMALAFTLLFLTLHLAAMRNEILRRRVRTHAADAGAEAGGG